MLRLWAFPRRCPFHAGSDAHGERGAFCPRGSGRGIAGEPVRAGVGPALRGAGCFRARSCGMDLSRYGWVSALPALNLACSGFSVGTTKDRWTELAAGRRNLRIALVWLYDEFTDAPVVGSLLNPATTKAAKLMDWPALATALAKPSRARSPTSSTRTAVAAQGLSKAAELLSGRYHLVATNVPYLARGKQGEELRRFCEQRYPPPRMISPPCSWSAAWSCVRRAEPPVSCSPRTGCFSPATRRSGRSC